MSENDTSFEFAMLEGLSQKAKETSLSATFRSESKKSIKCGKHYCCENLSTGKWLTPTTGRHHQRAMLLPNGSSVLKISQPNCRTREDEDRVQLSAMLNGQVNEMKSGGNQLVTVVKVEVSPSSCQCPTTTTTASNSSNDILNDISQNESYS